MTTTHWPVAWYRPRDVAEFANISISQVYRAIHSGELPANRFKDKTILIRREDAELWIESQTEPIAAVQG
jgi:excisionase family DNA binding protein